MFTEFDKKELVALRSSVLQYYSKKLGELNDPKLTSLFFNSCIITGGCISSIYHNMPVNDIDLYAKTTKDIKIISDFLKEVGVFIKTTKSYELEDGSGNTTQQAALITNNAITLTNDIQFITLAEAEVARNKFDFIHCMPWIDIKTQKLYISEAQFQSIKSRTLIANKSGEKPKDYRIQKYVSKGWTYNS